MVNKTLLIVLSILLLFVVITCASASSVSVALNSPTNGAEEYNSNTITTSASVSFTGLVLINITLYNNATGTWEAKNTTTLQTDTYLNTNPYAPTTSGGGVTGKTGMKVNFTENTTIKTVVQQSGGTATTAYICSDYACSTTYATSTFVSGNATFYYPAIAGTDYFILVGSGGSAYTEKYSNDNSPPYPKLVNNMWYIAGYNYDGNTNTGYSRAISSIQTSNMTLSSTQSFANAYPANSTILWNMKACVSNGTCLFAPANYTFKILNYLLINSVTYNSTIYETDYATYKINITANSSLTAVKLNYNGTQISMTNEGSGIWAYYRDIPSSSVGNNSLYFTLTYDGTDYNSLTYYQTVSSIVFIKCNGTYATNFLNITFKDESNLTSIPAQISSSTWTYYLGTGTQTKTYLFSNSTKNNFYNFCASPNITYYVSTELNYLDTGYPTRTWNSGVLTLTNTTTNQTLYLLNSLDGIYSTFITATQANTIISGASIRIVRTISGTNYTIAEGTTDSAGSATFWLNPIYDHYVTASATGYSTTMVIIKPTQSTYTIQLGETNNYTYLPDTRGLLWSFFPGLGWLISCGPTNPSTFGFNVSSYYGDLVACKIELLNNNKTITLASASANTSNSSLCSVSVSYASTTSYLKMKGRLLVDVGAGWQILEEDAYWSCEPINTTGMTATDWFNGLKDMDLRYFNDNENHREYTYILIFFLIVTIIMGILNYAGFDNQTEGGMIYITGLLVWIASVPGFLKLSGISPYELVDQYYLAVIYTMFMIGFGFRRLKRDG